MMSFTLAPAAFFALFALIPRAKADQVCDKDVFGVEHCHNDNPNDTKARLIVGLSFVGIGIVLIIVAGLLKRRRQRQAAAAAVANQPIMAYAPQGPSMMPSTYDPNAPPQPYPFNSYGQNVGGPMNPPMQYAPPTYAPPEGAPGKESV